MALRTTLLLCFACTCGCLSVDGSACVAPCKDEERQPTLFSWAILSDDKNKETAENGDKNDGESSDPKSKPLSSDRPDFTEASSTVGRGVIQFEGGYTYTRDQVNNTTTASHSYPQALFRVGVFADWFELRFGQNFANARSTGDVNEKINGAEDAYLGVKLGLTEQKQFLPEMALILQATLPTGHSELTSDRTLPGINWLFGWDVIKDKLDMGGSFQANKAIDDDGHSYLEVAQSMTIGYTLTEKLSAYTEWYAIYPSGALSPNISPQHYFDGGFTYKFTYNIQFDVNAGVGLNKHADDYFIGTGIVLRY